MTRDASPARRPGRPKRTDAPAIPYDEVEQILVFGEEITGGDGKKRRVFPTYRQLAKRYAVAHSVIANFAARTACLERRRQRYPEQTTAARKRPPARSRRRPSPAVPATPTTSATPSPAATLPSPPASERTEERRPRGRPRKIDSPHIPYDELDRALVFGELRQSLDAGGQLVVFPTVGELAERYGVAASLISRYATEHNCKQRREIAQFRVQARVDEKLVELTADTLADVKTELKLMAAELLRQFRERLREGAVRLDDPSTFNTIGRFLLLLDGQAEGRQEVAVGLSLADLEARHRQVIEEARRFSPLEAGIEDAQLAPPSAPDLDEDDGADQTADALDDAAPPPAIGPDEEASK